ncbi:MAG: 4Fe-4S dicluster domain-containing protein [Defluviitaleaceae bacterium]|nr:4Fe-4S dicluster domain-containing protein [Defluviitaleaceae bacterium]
MNDLTKQLKNLLLNHGAELVGVGDLSSISLKSRHDMPVGVSIAVKYPDDVIRGIAEFPTEEYAGWYDVINDSLDCLVMLGAQTLRSHGYAAIAMTREQVKSDNAGNSVPLSTVLPHKTVATRAGLGWIGKCALLVTPDCGSMIRLSTILTDAPLTADTPVNASACGDCTVCAEACPGGAVLGVNWDHTSAREIFFDAEKCSHAARKQAKLGFGSDAAICGKCIAVCPYTRRAWKYSQAN